MTNQDQLTLVANAFAQWRQTRPHRSTAIPDSLRQQAVALQTHYTKGKIINILRLSGSQLTAWTQQTKPDDHHTDFIPLPSATASAKEPLNLELSFRNGCQLRLSGDISPALLTALAQSVVV